MGTPRRASQSRQGIPVSVSDAGRLPSGGESSSSSRKLSRYLTNADNSIVIDARNECQIGNKPTRKRGVDASTLQNRGECSAMVPDDSEVAFLGSTSESSCSRSSMIHDPQYHISLVDMTLPEKSSNDSIDVGGQEQIEADEILARELQEQFYNERFATRNFSRQPNLVHSGLNRRGSSVVNIPTARTRGLRNHFFNQRRSRPPRYRNYSRAMPTSLMDFQFPLDVDSAMRNSSAHWDSRPHYGDRRSNRRGSLAGVSTARTRLRNRLHNCPPPSVPHADPNSSHATLNTAINFPMDMDLEMRIDILEALEASFDDVTNVTMMGGHALDLHDFNENDYEMLLTLDENNPPCGATIRQINSLPESIIDMNEREDACAICLEAPASGEKIRHLPCLHRFHKECIDQWLPRRPSCPVCLSSIT